MIDYHDLLEKYMSYVGEREGVHFIPYARDGRAEYREPAFTDEEVEALQAISDEITYNG